MGAPVHLGPLWPLSREVQRMIVVLYLTQDLAAIDIDRGCDKPGIFSRHFSEEFNDSRPNLWARFCHFPATRQGLQKLAFCSIPGLSETLSNCPVRFAKCVNEGFAVKQAILRGFMFKSLQVISELSTVDQEVLIRHGFIEAAGSVPVPLLKVGKAEPRCLDQTCQEERGVGVSKKPAW